MVYRLSLLVSAIGALVLAPPVARAEYCAFTGAATFSASGGVTVALSPVSAGGSLVACASGSTCSEGTCRTISMTDPQTYCAPADLSMVLWSCSGCTCPILPGAPMPRSVPVPRAMDGAICLCDYGATDTLCIGDGRGDAERFARCHTAPTAMATGRLTSFPNGDCDGDGYDNACEGRGGDLCEACAHPATCPAFADVVLPMCVRDAGLMRPDGGTIGLRDAATGATEGGVVLQDAGIVADFDAGSTSTPPPDPTTPSRTFNGGGGCVCIVASRSGSGDGALGAALATGFVIAMLTQRRRRK